jgi:hypothetical protein
MTKATRVFKAFLPAENRKGRNSDLMRLVNSLGISEQLFIPVDEWAATGLKSEPTALVHNSCCHPRALIFGKRFCTEKQKSGKLHRGWLITRRR